MNNFTRGLLIGGLVGTALGLTGMGNSEWVRRNFLKPSRKAIRKASKVMGDVAKMM